MRKIQTLLALLAVSLFGCVTTSPQISDSSSGPSMSSQNKTNPESSSTNCNDIDSIALIVGAHTSTPHSDARDFGFANFSSRVGKIELGPKKYGPKSAQDRFQILGASISKRKDFCGTPSAQDSRVEGYLVVELATSGYKEEWRDPYRKRTYFKFNISANREEAASVGKIPFGKYLVNVCASDSPNTECKDISTVYCSFGNCLNDHAKGDVEAAYGSLKSLDAYTASLYKERGETLSSMSGLPPAMTRVIDRVSGKLARIAKEKTLATTREFMRTFNVKVVRTNQTTLRPITKSGSMDSMAGSCKDITKDILIEKKRDAKMDKDVNIKVNFTLNRTYSPYALEQEGDPISIARNYSLNAKNGFKVADTIKYDCVLAAGRFHAAGLSFLGKLTGASKEQTGINTSLTKTSFDFDVEEIR